MGYRLSRSRRSATRHPFCTRRLIPRLTNRFDKISDVATDNRISFLCHFLSRILFVIEQTIINSFEYVNLNRTKITVRLNISNINYCSQIEIIM